jgi:hypothetical protein
MIKENINKWYKNNIYYLQECFNILQKWIDEHEELIFYVDYKTFFKYFIEMIFNEYVCGNKIINETNFDSVEYIEYKYTSDLTDIYIKFKDLSIHYYNDIFSKKNSSSDNIINLIANNIVLINDDDYMIDDYDIFE